MYNLRMKNLIVTFLRLCSNLMYNVKINQLISKCIISTGRIRYRPQSCKQDFVIRPNTCHYMVLCDELSAWVNRPIHVWSFMNEHEIIIKSICFHCTDSNFQRNWYGNIWGSFRRSVLHVSKVFQVKPHFGNPILITSWS